MLTGEKLNEIPKQQRVNDRLHISFYVQMYVYNMMQPVFEIIKDIQYFCHHYKAYNNNIRAHAYLSYSFLIKNILKKKNPSTIQLFKQI